MEPANPYRAPQAALGPAPSADDDGESVPEAIVADLVAARGWIFFFAAAFALKCIALAAAAFLIPNLPPAFVLGMLTGTAVIAVLAVLLFRTANGISDVERIPTMKRFEATLALMSAVWRVSGIIFGVTVAVGLFGAFFVRQFIGRL